MRLSSRRRSQGASCAMLPAEVPPHAYWWHLISTRHTPQAPWGPQDTGSPTPFHMPWYSPPPDPAPPPTPRHTWPRARERRRGRRWGQMERERRERERKRHRWTEWLMTSGWPPGPYISPVEGRSDQWSGSKSKHMFDQWVARESQGPQPIQWAVLEYTFTCNNDCQATC